MIRKTLSNALSLFPLGKIMVFESHPDYADNTYPVFQELRKRLPNYKMIWYVSKMTSKVDGVDDLLYFDDQSFINKVKAIYYKCFSKVFICSHRGIKKYRNDQLSLFLTHGSITKKTKGIYEPGTLVDFVSVQSHFFDKLTEEEFGAKTEQLIQLDFPRCDYFFKGDKTIDKQLKALGVNGKFLVWLPTFRKQQTSGRNAHSEQFEKMGIPLVYSEEMLQELDEFLTKRNIYIIYKPHPVHEIPTKTSGQLKNMRIISDDNLRILGVQLYQLLAFSEALITDYSSVYFDYLLLNRPMATTLDDVDCWKKGNGFAFDLEELYAKTNESLYTLDDLFRFIEEVVIGKIDTRENERLKMRDLANIYKDGNSAQRVADFVMDKIRSAW